MTDSTAPADLPPLPEPTEGAQSEGYMPGCSILIPASPDYFTAEQMRDYARAAVASSAPAVPDWDVRRFIPGWHVSSKGKK